MKIKNAQVAATHINGASCGLLVALGVVGLAWPASTPAGLAARRMQANTTNAPNEKIKDIASTNDSLASELDTVPIAGANTLAELLSTFSTE